MSTQIRYEKNSMRKSHRVAIPLKIDINHTLYNTVDWSLSGVSIKSVQDENFVDQNNYDAVLMLGLKDATISLRVKLKCIYKKEDKYGFEFAELSRKNKKVLRRYLELHLDGKLEQIDDLMAVYEEPDINSAIQEPVKLNEYEKKGLEKSFLRKSIGAILFSFLLLAGIAALLYQNLIYKFESVGTVDGNYKMVYPKKEGTIEKIYVKSGAKVDENSVLADINSEEMLYQIKLLESIKNSKLKERAMLSSLTKKDNNRAEDDDEVLTLKREAVKERLKELQNAKIQFRNHLITYADMHSIKKSYQDAKERYALYKKQRSSRKNSEQPLPKIINMEEVDLKIADKKRHLEDFRIFSPIDGTVYEMHAQEGNSVGKEDLLLTLWNHIKPQIICVVSLYKAAAITVGEAVEIEDSIGEKKFHGVVKQISNSAFDNDPKMTGAKNFNEVFVTIEPEKSAKVLPPQSIVKVLFKRTFGF